MKDKDFVQGLLDFIQQSSTPFHAVQSMVNSLEGAGLQRLDETQVTGRY